MPLLVCKLVGGDDASRARWLTIDDSLMSTRYADHFTFVQRALQPEFARVTDA